MYQCVSRRCWEVALLCTWLICSCCCSLSHCQGYCHIVNSLAQSMVKTGLLPSKGHHRTNKEKSWKREEGHEPCFSPNQCYLPVTERHSFLWSRLLEAIRPHWTNDGSDSSQAEAEGQQSDAEQPALLPFWYVVGHMVTTYIEIFQRKGNHRQQSSACGRGGKGE